jgi:hypothetical protein
LHAQGPDGQRKLREGPNISSYRGLKVINSRSFSMEEGAPPRDVLRRRVRVAEYYRIPYVEGVENWSFAFYDESKDAWQKFSWRELERMAMIGDIREMDSKDADWDDEDGHYERRVTKLPNYGMDAPVDVYVKEDLFKHMTVGQIEGDWAAGFRLEGTGGNLVLNPWYELCQWHAGDGTTVPVNKLNPAIPDAAGYRAFEVGLNAAVPNTRAAGDAANMHWRPAQPGGYPTQGRRYGEINAVMLSEYRFREFDAILQEFGYTGPSVTYKTDAAIAALARLEFQACEAVLAAVLAAAAAAVGGAAAAAAAFPVANSSSMARTAAAAAAAAGGGDAEVVAAITNVRDNAIVTYTAFANGSVAIPNNAVEDDYQRYLENTLCNGAHRGHPDYEHYSYRIARENFHRFFILYLSGKADHLPPRAREFFDNFNWQRIGVAAGAVARLPTFALLLARIYRIENAPANNIIPPGPGIVLLGATRPVVIAGLLEDTQRDRVELVIVRPNIEHNMLGIIMVGSRCGCPHVHRMTPP